MNLRRSLPPLNLLKAFEAAARHESFTRAAGELCVTQAAVSQQIKVLETALGVKLFDRAHKQLTLTDAGREYLDVIRDALDRIALGTMQLLQRGGPGVLNVSTSPDFASKWLVPRIGRFAAELPDVDMRISATLALVDLARSGIDVAIRHGDGHWDGLEATKLYAEPEVLFPVCSPALLKGRTKISAPRDLLKFPLLRLDGWRTWAKWFAAADVTTRPVRGPTLGQASMLIDAAIDGQGIALARTALAARDLLDGRLTIPIDLPLGLPKTYWIVNPTGSSNVARVQRFKTWALGEASAEYARLQAAHAIFG